MNNINFLAKETFPQSTYTFDFLQNMIKSVSMLARLGGDNYILQGCDIIDDTITDGIVVINGEVLPFIGGPKKDKIRIHVISESDSYNGVDYPEAYIHRKVILTEDGNISFDNLKRVLTNKEIEDRFKQLKGDVPGTVKMWAGTIASIPEEYMLCDGRPLKNNDYPELSKNLNAIHGVEGTDAFLLPDLRGRFIVGQSNTNADYTNVGTTGGLDKVTLTIKQMPKHQHVFSDDVNAQGKYPSVEANFPEAVGGTNDLNTSASGSAGRGTIYKTSHAGGSESHENRPPYLVLAYIIKVK